MREVTGEPADWGTSDYLLAHVVDGINYLLYAYIASHSKGKPREPQPVTRPTMRHVPNERQRMSTPNEVAAFFGGGAVKVQGR